MTGAGGRRRLGRGLEALLGPVTVEEAREEGNLKQLPVDALRPNPYQPRRVFDESALSELAESMQRSGLLQPIVARAAENGEYDVVVGERRWRAAQQLGWTEIAAVVRDVDDRTLLTLALVENAKQSGIAVLLTRKHGHIGAAGIYSR